MNQSNNRKKRGQQQFVSDARGAHLRLFLVYIQHIGMLVGDNSTAFSRPKVRNQTFRPASYQIVLVGRVGSIVNGRRLLVDSFAQLATLLHGCAQNRLGLCARCIIKQTDISIISEPNGLRGIVCTWLLPTGCSTYIAKGLATYITYSHFATLISLLDASHTAFVWQDIAIARAKWSAIMHYCIYYYLFESQTDVTAGIVVGRRFSV